MRSPGWTGWKRVVPPFSLSIIPPSFSPEKCGCIKHSKSASICKSIKMLNVGIILNVEGFLFTAAGRVCPQNSSSASAKKQLKNVCEPSVSVCVATHQQHDSRRGQMCPCYIIDDGGRKQSLRGGRGGVKCVVFFSFSAIKHSFLF